MGHDLHIMGRHSLNTSSIEELAKECSVRFKVNVEYGYRDEFWFDWDGFHREASIRTICGMSYNIPMPK